VVPRRPARNHRAATRSRGWPPACRTPGA
jgi:hypothetical protein